MATFAHPTAERARVSLRAVVDGTMHWIPAALASRAVVRVEHADAPDVMINEGQMGQVVINLVNNGARAIPEGRRGAVTVRTGPGSPGTVRLEVSDDGVGIPPEVMKRMFDPFFSTRLPGHGTGLGLPVVHSIVTAHQGSIQVSSEVGRGSTFRVELPAAPPEATAP